MSISIYYGIHSDIRGKSYCRLILIRASLLNFERLNILRIHSDIRVKSYYRLIFLRVSTLNFEHLDILRDTIEHPSKNLLSFEFDHSFCFQFRVSIYYGTQSVIRVKSNYRFIYVRASVLNFKRLDILLDTIGHPNKKL